MFFFGFLASRFSPVRPELVDCRDLVFIPDCVIMAGLGRLFKAGKLIL